MNIYRFIAKVVVIIKHNNIEIIRKQRANDGSAQSKAFISFMLSENIGESINRKSFGEIHSDLVPAIKQNNIRKSVWNWNVYLFHHLYVFSSNKYVSMDVHKKCIVSFFSVAA